MPILRNSGQYSRTSMCALVLEDNPVGPDSRLDFESFPGDEGLEETYATQPYREMGGDRIETLSDFAQALGCRRASSKSVLNLLHECFIIPLSGMTFHTSAATGRTSAGCLGWGVLSLAHIQKMGRNTHETATNLRICLTRSDAMQGFFRSKGRNTPWL